VLTLTSATNLAVPSADLGLADVSDAEIAPADRAKIRVDDVDEAGCRLTTTPAGGASKIYKSWVTDHTGPHAGIFFPRREILETSNQSRKPERRILSRTATRGRSPLRYLFSGICPSDAGGAVKSLERSSPGPVGPQHKLFR
jgi:hypothetical protein